MCVFTTLQNSNLFFACRLPIVLSPDWLSAQSEAAECSGLCTAKKKDRSWSKSEGKGTQNKWNGVSMQVTSSSVDEDVMMFSDLLEKLGFRGVQ